jgi:TatD DNase family protein
LSQLRNHLEAHRDTVIAIGETGLDHYWDLTYKEEQEKAFRMQAEWAMEFDLPIVIHSRNSTDALINVLKDINDSRLKGVFHCFSGTPEQAEVILGLGFYLGIGGVVTFKNGGLDKILPSLPMEKILLETDGPYLAPAPHRGKRNVPSYLRLVAEKIGVIKSMTVEDVGKITSMNASKLFSKSVL